MAIRVIGGAYSGVGVQGTGESRAALKFHGPQTAFFDRIFESCGFGRYASRSAPITFLDAMSGPGRLGLGIKARLGQRAAGVQFYFNDVQVEPLMELPGDSLHARCDVRELGTRYPLQFHIIAVRYGLKELPSPEQPAALASLRESLVPGGRLVVADMTASSADAQAGIIAVHAARQRLAGREEDSEGRCHIPRLEEWTVLLTAAGFANVTVAHSDASVVNTKDWFGQFYSYDAMAIPMLNGIIRNMVESNPAFRDECRVSIAVKPGAPPIPVSELQGSHLDVSLSFPTVVMTADKPG